MFRADTPPPVLLSFMAISTVFLNLPLCWLFVLNLSNCWAQLLMQCGSWLTYTVLSSSSVLSAAVMAVLLVRLSVLLLSIHTPSRASPSCPVSCRCYSLTVECGSTGLRDIPKHVPPSTQVDSWCWRRTISNITTDILAQNQKSYIKTVGLWAEYIDQMCFCSYCLIFIQTIFLQDNVIGQIRRQDLILLRHLHYLYLQARNPLIKNWFWAGTRDLFSFYLFLDLLSVYLHHLEYIYAIYVFVDCMYCVFVLIQKESEM